MYPWKAHVAEHGFEECKWLGHFNARGDIEDIKRVNANVESSTTMLEFQEWMPIRVLTRCKTKWEVDPNKCKNDGSWRIHA